ncbi:hypothetical protein MAPG_11538 [Magnaporthiopsis poae ATCC 64411]|uniref:Heterokaryon incompatibility domain-containing protein n=1 Tax=Magnaporthiopsis poae (strain ATCC 64411 / 73-15) TaxID=644358 RepID=A0A0C4EFI8_MAGP6|nr:hypothetical protein MAPG_11538 [Magnaporthiopsis poae ATCC 64411]
MPKRKRTQSSTAGEAAAPSPDESTPVQAVSFHRLCETCQQISRLVGQPKRTQVLEFHTRGRLNRSVAEKRCHLCCKLQGLVAQQEVIDGPKAASESLHVVIQHYNGSGTSIILVRGGASGQYLGSIDFRFKDASEIRAMKFFHSASTQSEESWAQIVNWVSCCANNHPSCRSARQQRSSNPPSISELPKRLLAVGGAGDSQIRVCETQDIVAGALPIPLYTTLSHRWGDIKPTRLLRQGYKSVCQGIRLDALPKTFRDAVLITRKLGIPYLWIDSLCIIQDSTSDWETESVKMLQVYKHSFLNICAAASLDATGGLFYPRDPLSVVPCVIQTGPGEDQCLASTYDSDIRSGELEILKRAWVFQELTLAPRVLFFAHDELYWQCYDLEGSETMPMGIIHSEPLHAVTPLHRRLTELHAENNSLCGDTWCQLVKEYSGRRLTRFSDKLVAVAGLAAEFGRVWNNTTYLAGLWNFRLRQGLLWTPEEHGLPQKSLSYTAPSWSWACVDTKCHLRPSDYYRYSEGLSEVIDASVQLSKASDPYGRVVSGTLRLEGPLVEALVSSLPGKETVLDGWVTRFDAKLDRRLEDDMGMLTEVPTRVWWDDKATSALIRAATVHLAPFELVLSWQGLSLEGLILTPTHSKPGEYRRLGRFRVADKWQDALDSEATAKVFCVTPEGDDDASQDEGDSIESRDYTTRGLVMAAIEAMERREQAATNDPRFEIMRRRMDKTGGSDRFRPGDPYHNGIINRSLVLRYRKELQVGDYPRINSFLCSTHFLTQISDEKQPGDCGEGYFRFEVV